MGAFVLTWTEKRWPERQEALIGVLFVLASCAGLLLLANNPHGGEHLKDLLVGQILWVSARQLVVMLVVTGAVLVVWLALGRRVGPISFYALFAIAVTASVQLVGVYLVFASLIVPALATSAMASRRSRLLAGFSIGAAGYAVGFAMSSLIDLPSGPLIVLVMTALAIAAAGMVAYLKPRATVPRVAEPVIVSCETPRPAACVRAAAQVASATRLEPNPFTAAQPSPANSTRTRSCVTTNAGAACVGATAIRPGVFWKSCTSSTKTFR